MGRKIKVIIISIIVSLVIFYTIIQIGIKLNPNKPKNSNEIKIVTTIFPYYDFAKAVVGNDENIHLLISPGGEIHSYEPTPLDIIEIQKADVFIYNGGENDEWVDEILKTIDTSKLTIIKMMDYVETIEEEDKYIYTENEKHDENEEIEYDEHIWTSPKNAITLVKTISQKLISIDEKNKETYEKNAQKYINEIEDIDSEIQEIVNNSRTKLLIFGDRFPFRYFVEQYGLKYRAAFSGCSSETEPSASTITKLITEIKRNDVPVVLYIELSSKKVATTLSEETNTEVMCLQSCQSISKEDFNKGKTYVSIMKENIETLKAAL